MSPPPTYFSLLVVSGGKDKPILSAGSIVSNWGRTIPPVILFSSFVLVLPFSPHLDLRLCTFPRLFSSLFFSAALFAPLLCRSFPDPFRSGTPPGSCGRPRTVFFVSFSPPSTSSLERCFFPNDCPFQDRSSSTSLLARPVSFFFFRRLVPAFLPS